MENGVGVDGSLTLQAGTVVGGGCRERRPERGDKEEGGWPAPHACGWWRECLSKFEGQRYRVAPMSVCRAGVAWRTVRCTRSGGAGLENSLSPFCASPPIPAPFHRFPLPNRLCATASPSFPSFPPFHNAVGRCWHSPIFQHFQINHHFLFLLVRAPALPRRAVQQHIALPKIQHDIPSFNFQFNIFCNSIHKFCLQPRRLTPPAIIYNHLDHHHHGQDDSWGYPPSPEMP